MEANFELRSSQSLLSHEDEGKEYVQISAKISEVFHSKLNLFGSSTKQEDENSQVIKKDGDQNETEVTCDNDGNEDVFSFPIHSSGSTPISNNIASTDAHIQPKFSLFNRDLLLPHTENTISQNQLPSQSQVEKVFIKKLSKNSSSTGFSKLSRSKEYLHRSSSDNFIVNLYRSQKESRRRWRIKMYSHQCQNQIQNNKTFLASTKN